MGAYFAHGVDTSTDETTIIELAQPASALKRIKITALQIGAHASADAAYKAVLSKITAVGSGGTAPTPTPRDPADGAASAVFRYADTSEPTYPGTPVDQLVIAAHQRATYQWMCQPGHEIVIPKTNSEGVGLLIKEISSAFTMDVGLEWEE